MKLLWKIYASKKNNIKFISDLINLVEKDSIFKHFYYFDKLSSTQDYAFKIIKRKKKIHPSVIICNIQTNGKGRKGSSWSSPKGGIWMSLILETSMKVEHLFIFVMISAVCICETIEKKTNIKPHIKWPNDIFINGKKIAGILLDVETDIDGKNKLILGMGINTKNDLDVTILEIQKNNLSYYPVTTMKKELNGSEISNIGFLSRLLYNLNVSLLKIDTNSFFYDHIFKNYKDRIMNSKNSLQYSFKNDDNEAFEGELIDLARDGSLIVKDIQQKKLKISSADNVNIK